MKMEHPHFTETPESEKVLEACLKFRGETFTGASHSWALDRLEKVYPDWKSHKGEIQIGFLTNKGRIVTHSEAEKLPKEKPKES